MLVAAPVLSNVPLVGARGDPGFRRLEHRRVRPYRTILVSASWGDRIVLLVTFVLTVLVDLTIAIEAGVALAALMFMHRMANAVEIEERTLDDRDDAVASVSGGRVIVYRINGPFFFGATQKLATVLDNIGEAPQAYVLDLGAVPLIDSTAVAMLESFVARANARDIAVIFAATTPAVRKTLARFGIVPPHVRFAETVEAARLVTGRREVALEGATR